MPLRTVNLFRVPVLAATLEETADECMRLLHEGGSYQHVCLNVRKLVLMEDDASLRGIVESCDIVSADGASIVLAARVLGRPLPERVAGIDLMEALLGRAENEGYPVYFLGATESVLTDFLGVCAERFPRLQVAGHRDGYFDDVQLALAAVRESGARILFVGMPSPRKEYLLAEHTASLPGVFAMGVGGSFDVWAGRTTRAPVVLQKAGMEWAYRLVQEPRRMWKRYMVGNARFFVLLVREAMRG
jgi:N-acetylglucosaminyldiphosphoundecaprenol N-acetyl-beta-D-mannosaminyltransferase